MKVSAISPSYSGYSRVSKNEKLNVPANKTDSVSFKRAEIELLPKLYDKISRIYPEVEANVNMSKWAYNIVCRKLNLFHSAEYLRDEMLKRANEFPDGLKIILDVEKQPTLKTKCNIVYRTQYSESALYKNSVLNDEYFEKLIELIKKDDVLDKEMPHVVNNLKNNRSEVAAKMMQEKTTYEVAPWGEIYPEDVWKADVQDITRPERVTFNTLSYRIEPPAAPKENDMYIPGISELNKLDDIFDKGLEKIFTFFGL